MVMLNIKVSGSQNVKIPGVLGEERTGQSVWSIDVSRVIHEAGGTNNGQGLVRCFVICLFAMQSSLHLISQLKEYH